MRFPLFTCYLRLRGMLVTAGVAIGMTSVPFLVIWYQIPPEMLATRIGSPIPWQALILPVIIAWSVGRHFVAGNTTLSEFEAVLPIAPRDLAVTRILAMAVFWLIPVWASIATIVTLSVTRGIASQGLAQGLSMALSVSGCVLLAMVIRYRTLRSEPSRFQSVLVSLLTLALMAVGFLLPFPWVGAMALVLAAVVRWYSYRTAPMSVELPIARTRRPSRTSASTPRSYTLNRLFLDYWLLHWWPLMFMVLSCANFMSALATGDTDIFSLLIPFGFLGIPAQQSLQALRLLAHLPVLRQRLFAWFVLPPMAAILLSLTIGYLAFDGDSRRDALIEFDRGPDVNCEEVYDLRVRPDWWRITTGEPPLVTAPNGDSQRPTAHSIGPFTLYNPYEAGYKPGTEFLAYQLSRALRDCCDLDLTPGQVQTRYLSDARWRSGLDPDEYPELRKQRSLTHFALYVLLSLLLSLVVLSSLFYRNRPAASKSEWIRQQVIRWAPSLLVFGAAIAMLWSLGLSPVRPDEVGLTGPVWNLVQELFADYILIAIPLGAALIAVSYIGLERRFEHMEPPAPSKRSQIVDRSLIEV